MMMLTVVAGIAVTALVVVMFARHGGPTRSIAHVLHDTEHPPR
jgi:hypothetical protein